jgi:uncharacterized glyoxalase superfamily protein PhnB
MFNAISISSLFVLDQDEALEFYVGKLGFEVHTDADIGSMRWLTINVPGDAGRQILLERPGPPSMDDATAGEVREHVTKGVAGSVVLTTDDCRRTCEELAAQDVEITQEPMERPYGVDMGIRDPFGNHLRITELAAVQPTDAELRDAFTR